MQQIWTPLPIGARCIVASIYCNSTGIPILNSSADFFNSLWTRTIRRVLSICYDIAYWFCFTGEETEIRIKDHSKIKRHTNLDRRRPRPIPIICHLPDPPSFSLPTTFKVRNKSLTYCHRRSGPLLCIWETKINTNVVFGPVDNFVRIIEGNVWVGK